MPLAASLWQGGLGCNFTLLWHTVQSFKTITCPFYRLLWVVRKNLSFWGMWRYFSPQSVSFLVKVFKHTTNKMLCSNNDCIPAEALYDKNCSISVWGLVPEWVVDKQLSSSRTCTWVTSVQQKMICYDSLIRHLWTGMCKKGGVILMKQTMNMECRLGCIGMSILQGIPAPSFLWLQHK